MKHVKLFEGFLNEAMSPYDQETECVISGTADYDIVFSMDRNWDGPVGPGMFEGFVGEIKKLLEKNAKAIQKRGVSSCEIFTPLNAFDDSYEDWAKTENGDYEVGLMAFKMVCEVDEFYTQFDGDDVVDLVIDDISPNMRDLAAVAKRYKFVDNKDISIEDSSSELDTDCN